MEYIITYTIPDPMRRWRLIKVLTSFHATVDWDAGVAQCRLDTQQLKQLRSALEFMVEPDQDAIFIQSSDTRRAPILIGAASLSDLNKKRL
ncbi:CRISPR/Cas system-associated endoribonuclease Cas2 [Desulfurispira natronophila]|uniref:CRISPR/Cas system-associated endoribonuclease Cas2 n=1 Tax=Desulfurispira natronophila TaxID=682562 RepID=A0A7W8DH70_9BACT|nr:CRISPR/Cas system-associated endoribonuclease Cas2 [Desulfurispira natronophila]